MTSLGRSGLKGQLEPQTPLLVTEGMPFWLFLFFLGPARLQSTSSLLAGVAAILGHPPISSAMSHGLMPYPERVNGSVANEYKSFPTK
ncbi:hypothetical protein P170DRAFT_105895 [Aspergillus steynii IBT 23096]|uniref:Uncharacterized protein n=1 Tax=Aspergillus steynii IBT 23096 TaxID=1392250 RepID=A0A2I2GI28_9EURO|nr:uncharacterized protein P170DRAFT_105895 [Aspergillus steynii IBT 23096]PLB52530.1 hypothetical protein P170DRAFT_105895 [Aspergillus steynii IBT 23096]